MKKKFRKNRFPRFESSGFLVLAQDAFCLRHKSRSFSARNKQGQILILVLLIVVVSLAIGLSVAARNLTNLRITTQTELSQRAFYAAEYGIEDQLYKLQNSIAACTTTCSVTPVTGGIPANVISSAQSSLQKTVLLGDIAQLNLQGAACPGGGNNCTIRIGWAAPNSSETSNYASLEVTEICNNSGYKQVRFYVQGQSHAGEALPAVNAPYNLATALACDGLTLSKTYAVQTALAGQAYSKYVDIPLLIGAYLMRIRPLWNNTTVYVIPTGTTVSLPTQSYQITSTNDTTSTNGVTRKIQVTKSTLPQLPAVFDFAVYSDQAISK